MDFINQNQPLFFYSDNYSIILDFDALVERLFGQICLSSQYGSVKIPFKTFYTRDDIIKFTFCIDWSISSNKNYGFTMFSGQIINQNVLILDWLMVVNGVEEYSLNGANFLYSTTYINSYGKKNNTFLMPFPKEFLNNIDSLKN